MYEVVKKYCLTLKTNDYPHPAALKQILKNKNRKKSTKKQFALFNEKLSSKFIFLSVLCLVGCLKLELTNMQTCVYQLLLKFQLNACKETSCLLLVIWLCQLTDQQIL